MGFEDESSSVADGAERLFFFFSKLTALPKVMSFDFWPFEQISPQNLVKLKVNPEASLLTSCVRLRRLVGFFCSSL